MWQYHLTKNKGHRDLENVKNLHTKYNTNQKGIVRDIFA